MLKSPFSFVSFGWSASLAAGPAPVSLILSASVLLFAGGSVEVSLVPFVVPPP